MPVRSYYDLIAQLAGLGPVGESPTSPYAAPPLGGAGTMFPPASGMQFNPTVQLDPSQVRYGTPDPMAPFGLPRDVWADALPQFWQNPFHVGIPLGGWRYPQGVVSTYPYGPYFDEMMQPQEGPAAWGR